MLRRDTYSSRPTGTSFGFGGDREEDDDDGEMARDATRGCEWIVESGWPRMCEISESKAGDRARSGGLYVGPRTGLEACCSSAVSSVLEIPKTGTEQETNERLHVNRSAKNDSNNGHHVLVNVVKHDEETNIFLSVELAMGKSEGTLRCFDVLVGTDGAFTEKIRDRAVKVCGGGHGERARWRNEGKGWLEIGWGRGTKEEDLKFVGYYISKASLVGTLS